VIKQVQCQGNKGRNQKTSEVLHQGVSWHMEISQHVVQMW